MVNGTPAGSKTHTKLHLDQLFTQSSNFCDYRHHNRTSYEKLLSVTHFPLSHFVSLFLPHYNLFKTLLFRNRGQLYKAVFEYFFFNFIVVILLINFIPYYVLLLFLDTITSFGTIALFF